MVETRVIPIGEHSFTVDVAGPANGAPVLLLHGFPQTRHMWRDQLDALGRRGYRAIAPDQRGYSAGARPADVEAYATGLLIADALALMDAFGAPRFHLVGHDWGGQIAWLIAAGHAERVRSLSIFSRPHPAAFARALREDPLQAERSGHHRAFREGDAVARMRQAGLKPLRDALDRQGVPAAEVAIYMETLMQPGAIEGAMNWYRASGLVAEATAKIVAPTLYVWGRDDATVGAAAAALTEQYVTGSYRFEAIDGAGHFLIDQFPRRASDLIVEHLRDHA